MFQNDNESISSLTCSNILRPPNDDFVDDTSWHCAWSPSGQVLASCHGKRIFMWTNKTRGRTNIKCDIGSSEGNDKNNNQWELLGRLPDVHERTVRCIAFSPCGTVLASASFDGTVAIFEKTNAVSTVIYNDKELLDCWECTAQLEGHESEVKHVCWNSAGTLLATCGRDKAVWIWECILPMVSPHEASGSARGISEFECVAVLHGHTGDVKSITFSPSLGQFGDGEEILLSTSYDDTIKCWAEDTACGEWYCAFTLNGHKSTVWSVATASGGARLVTASEDNGLGIWKMFTASEAESLSLKRDHHTDGAFKCVGVLNSAHKGAVYSVHCPHASAGHGRIASVGADDNLNIYREVTNGATSDKPLFDLDISVNGAHSGEVNCIRWNPRDGSLLATTGDDGVVKLWNYLLR